MLEGDELYVGLNALGSSELAGQIDGAARRPAMLLLDAMEVIITSGVLAVRLAKIAATYSKGAA